MTKKKLLIGICMGFFLYSAPLQAQLWEGKDTVYRQGNYWISLHSLSNENKDSLLNNQLIALYTNASYKLPVQKTVFQLDSILNLLKGKVHFEFKHFEWENASTHFVSSFICRNGMKVILNNPMPIDRYYPDRDVIVFENGLRRAINLKTGEDDIETGRIEKIKGGLRVLVSHIQADKEDINLMIQEPNRWGYSTLADLTSLTENTFRNDFYFVINNTLYILFYDYWWKVTFSKIR